MSSKHLKYTVAAAIISLAHSCGGTEYPSTLVPELQQVTDSVLTECVPFLRAESAFAVALGREGRIISLYPSPGEVGQSGTHGAPLIRPAGLFLPVLVASAMADGTLTDGRLPAGIGLYGLAEPLDSALPGLAKGDTISGIRDGLALDSRYLTALAASSYGSVGPFEETIRCWFPHSLSLVPGNVPPEDRNRYALETFLGEETLVRADEAAAFYHALAGGGRRAAPAMTAKEVRIQRILPESVADSLYAWLLEITGYACSTSCVGPGFPVAGKSGTTEVPLGDGGQGVRSSFVGTFFPARGDYEPVTLLVTVTLPAEGDATAAQRVFERLAPCLREALGGMRRAGTGGVDPARRRGRIPAGTDMPHTRTHD